MGVSVSANVQMEDQHHERQLQQSLDSTVFKKLEFGDLEPRDQSEFDNVGLAPDGQMLFSEQRSGDQLPRDRVLALR